MRSICPRSVPAAGSCLGGDSCWKYPVRVCRMTTCGAISGSDDRMCWILRVAVRGISVANANSALAVDASVADREPFGKVAGIDYSAPETCYPALIPAPTSIRNDKGFAPTRSRADHGDSAGSAAVQQLLQPWADQKSPRDRRWN